MALLGVLIIGLGIWVAFPEGGGGIGEEGPAGGAGGVATPESANNDEQDRSEGAVDIVDGSFKPTRVEVVGQSQVTFVNRDDVEHGVDFEDPEIKDRKRIAPGESYVVELPGKGEYKFADPTGDGMSGTVVVGG